MRRKVTGVLIAAMLAVCTLSPITAKADGQKVVTLGADLTEEQKNAVLKYFGILGQNVQTLIITNQDERNHLGSYVPLEQIGTRTFSCALVNPTSSGGIQVKTANLNWVTGNMIATTLSTSGVTNCQVLAASPFEVSGTGALTGVIMAYESASGRPLDATKKQIATEELITTGNIANQVGQDTATNIVNEIKIQVIEGQVVDPQEVQEIVEDVVDQTAASLNVEDRQMLEDLANKIAQQQYDYDQMKETLERVEQNTSAGVNVNVNVTNNNTQENNQTNNNEQTNNNDQNVSQTNDQDVSQTNDQDQAVDVSNDSSSSSDADGSSDDNIFIDAGDTTDLGGDVITTNSVEASNLNENDIQNESSSNAEQQQSADDGFSWTEETFTFDDGSGSEGGNDEGSQTQPESDPFSFENTDESILNGDGSDQPADQNTDEWTDDGWSEGTNEGGENIETTDPYEDQNTDVESQENVDTDNGEQAEGGEEEGAEEGVEEAGAITLGGDKIRILPGDSTDEYTGIAGTSVVRIALADVELDAETLNGTLEVLDAFGTQITSSELSDISKAAVRTLEADKMEEFDLYDTQGGSELLVLVGNVFADPGEYTISLNNFSARTTSGQDVTAEPVSTYLSVDETAGLLLNVSSITDLKAGNTVSAEVLLDGIDYVYASVYCDDHSGSDVTDVSADASSFNLTLYDAGTTMVSVDFYAEDGSVMAERDFIIPVL